MRYAMKALGALARSCSDRYRSGQQAMKALCALAVAEQDIRALRTARADSACSDD